MKLVVTHPFANFNRGDEIVDPAEMDFILAGEHAAHVVKVALPQ